MSNDIGEGFAGQSALDPLYSGPSDDARDVTRTGKRMRSGRHGALTLRRIFFATGIGLALGAPLRAAADDGRVTDETIERFAAPFLQGQLYDGSYDITAKVQVHLKTEIAMALAAAVTLDPRYGDSARRDHAWVIRYFLEPSGGLTWDGPQSEFFFECHQHWFLIASHLIGDVTDTLPATLENRRAVWTFLQRSNPSGQDFYWHNLTHNDAFFGYRCVDREGGFMTQYPFKGAYEVGVALWSLAILKATGEIDPDSTGDDSLSVSVYLSRSVEQAALSPSQRGFYAPAEGRWIRSLRWHNPGWYGCEEPDWKYALHLEEGALEYRISTGESVLDVPIRAMLQELLDRVQFDGTLADFPDAGGTVEYEYGEAMSVLGAAAVAFAPYDPLLAEASLRAGESVSRHALITFAPAATEDCAMLLGGLARILQGQQANVALTMDVTETGPARAATLRIAPAAAAGPRRITWSGPETGRARLLVVDVTGRQLASLPVPGMGGSLDWEPRDAQGRDLSAGRYFMILETPESRSSRGFTVLR
jgi:hypothetical protein